MISSNGASFPSFSDKFHHRDHSERQRDHPLSQYGFLVYVILVALAAVDAK
jgi:hypothetical protein